MRPINLIPEDEQRQDRVAIGESIFGYAIVGLLALAVVGAIFYATTSVTVSERKTEVAGLESQVAIAEAEAAELAPYITFAATAEARRETVAQLAASRFDWERIMRELSLIVPDDVVVQTLTATSSPSVSVPGGTSVDLRSEIEGPALELTGCGTGKRGEAQEAVAGFIAALYQIDGVTRVGMKDSAVGGEGEEAGGGGPTGVGGCHSGTEVANYQLVVAFDHVPAPEDRVEPIVPPGDPAAEGTPAQTDGAAPDTSSQASAAAAEAQANAAVDTYTPGG